MDEKKTNYTNEIKQSRELPRFRYKLGVNEQKMLLCFFGQLKQTDEAFLESEISLPDVVKYCGFDTANPYRLVSNTAKELAKGMIEYYHGKDYDFIPWFSYIRSKNGKIYYQLNNAIKSELLQLYDNNKIYVTIDPLLLPRFKTNFGLRLYLIFRGELTSHRNEILYSVEELCSMLMLSSAYNPKNTVNAAGNQRVKVIEPAVQEINTVSNITVSYTPIKESRKITGWRFSLANKETTTPTLPSSEPPQLPTQSTPWYTDEKVDAIIKSLIKHGVDKARMPSLLQRYTNAEDFLKAAAVAESSLADQQSKGEVQNPGGVLAQVLNKYDPALTRLFDAVDAEITESAQEKQNKANAVVTAIQTATAWEDIIAVVIEQTSKEAAGKILKDAAEQRPDLLKQYQQAYAIQYPQYGPYDIDIEIASMNVPDGTIQRLKAPAVDYSLLDNK